MLTRTMIFLELFLKFILAIWFLQLNIIMDSEADFNKKNHCTCIWSGKSRVLTLVDPNNHIAMNWRHVCDTNIKYLLLRFLLFLFLTSFGGLGRIKHPSFPMVSQMSVTDSRRCTCYCHVKFPRFPSSRQWQWRHAHVWSSSHCRG